MHITFKHFTISVGFKKIKLTRLPEYRFITISDENYPFFARYLDESTLVIIPDRGFCARFKIPFVRLGRSLKSNSGRPNELMRSPALYGAFPYLRIMLVCGNRRRSEPK